MDVEELLENCWTNLVGSNGTDDVMRISRKRRFQEWKKVCLDSEKKGGSVLLQKEDGEISSVDEEDELEEGEFVRPDSFEDDELEEGEFVEDYGVGSDHGGDLVKKSDSTEDDEFVESVLRDYEIASEDVVMEVGEFVDPVSINIEAITVGSDNEEASVVEPGELVVPVVIKKEVLSNDAIAVGSADLLNVTKEEGELEEGEFAESESCQQLEMVIKQEASDLYLPSVNATVREECVNSGVVNHFTVRDEGALGDPSMTYTGILQPKEENLHGSLVLQQTVDSGPADLIQLKEAHDHQEPFSHGATEGNTHKFFPRHKMKTHQTFPSGWDVIAVGHVDLLNATKEEGELEEGELAEPVSCQQVGIVIKQEASDQYPPLINTTVRDDCVNSGFVNDFTVRDEGALGDPSMKYTGTFQPKEEMLHGSLVSQQAVESGRADLIQLKEAYDHQEPFSHGAIEGNTHTKFPRRRMTAYRSFPSGCGRLAMHDIMEDSERPVQNSIYKASAEKLRVRKMVGANPRQWREDPNRYVFEEKYEGKRLQGSRVVEYEHGRKDLDSKLIRKETKPSMSQSGLRTSVFANKGGKSSLQELGMRTMNLGNDKRNDRGLSGNCVPKTKVINPSREKCDAVESSAGRVTIQALMAEPNCPWMQGRQNFKPDVGLKQSTLKGIKKKVDIAPNRFKSICDSENEDYFCGDGEDDDSPATKRSRNTLGGTDDNIQVGASRKKVRKTLSLFQTICRILLRGEEGKSNGVAGIRRVDLMAGTILRENNRWVNRSKQIIGSVPGVEVGDEFHYRAELAMIGLHRHYQAGIDYVDSGGMKLATSIVASGGYDDMMVKSDSDILLYSGHGGNPTRGATVATDQKLVGGNLALVNSRKVGNDVRVIRGFRHPNSVDSRLNMPTLVYDGLYLVEDYWQQTGSYGNQVYMFQLRRKPGQPELAIKELTKSRKSSVREGICVKDISAGKEKIPICAINTVDSEIPPAFEYIARMKHHLRYKPTPSQGCQCSDGCSSSMKCSCALKNGGQIPFNYNGAIVESRPLIYECGPHCKCPPSCYNKVSQRGIKFPLEVFKTKSRGWGVRSLSSIPSGSFICEYTGELLNENDAEQRIGQDAYLFDIGRSNNDDALWEGLSDPILSDLRSDMTFEAVEDVGFTIDAAHYGNVGRFINHSCSPNLYAQNVLYDHDDKRMPHIMFFSAENIPPLKELTYHYNMAVNQVLDRDGNVRKLKCNCGSIECTGRIY